MDFNQLLYWHEVFEADVEEAEEELEVERVVLPQTNPFQLSNHKFVQLFRLTKDLTNDLVDMVTPFMALPTRASALSITTKVLAALRFYAFGSYQEVTGSNHFVGISQASMSRAINEVTNALNQQAVLNQKIQFPRTPAQQEALRTQFFEMYGFPGILGVIDCTHVAIVAPPSNDQNHPEHVYVNRKNYHSINVQLICDPFLKILNVSARFPGSTHDAFIWSQSPVSTVMEQVYWRNPGNALFLIGDSGYPTRPWLLTPLPNPTNPGEEHFNQRFRSIRSLIERCNGVLKNRFRCLLRYRTLHYDPVFAGKIVNACCVLHNVCIDNATPEPNEEHPDEPDYGMYQRENFNVQGRIPANPDLATARQLQHSILINHFNRP